MGSDCFTSSIIKICSPVKGLFLFDRKSNNNCCLLGSGSERGTLNMKFLIILEQLCEISSYYLLLKNVVLNFIIR